jgi:Ulp1 family protease
MNNKSELKYLSLMENFNKSYLSNLSLKSIKQTNTPQQNNSYDCGVFTCLFLEFIMKDIDNSKQMPNTFSNKIVEDYRIKIFNSIWTGKLCEIIT